MKVFVTVGTTKFPKLVDTITIKGVIDILLNLGVDFVQIQTGKDFQKPNLSPELNNFCTINKENDCTVVRIYSKITIKYNHYFEDFEEQIKRADLVISHAGAGTCLDVLRQNKPLIVVINEDLMNNHQTELAEQLADNGHLFHCACESLVEALNNDFSRLKPYPKSNEKLFSHHLDRYCGYIK